MRLTDATGQELHRRVVYLAEPKDLNLASAKPQVSMLKTKIGYELTLTTGKLLKNVYLHLPAAAQYSDNYFDLLPGQPKTIEIKTNQVIEQAEQALEIFSLNQI